MNTSGNNKSKNWQLVSTYNIIYNKRIGSQKHIFITYKRQAYILQNSTLNVLVYVIRKFAKEFCVVQSSLYLHFVNASLPDCRGHCFHCRLYEIDELREIASSRGMLFLLGQYIPCQCDRLGVDRVTSTHLRCLNQCQQQCATTCYLYNLYKRLSTRQQQYGLDINRV